MIELLEGNIFIDDRGSVSFVNCFDFNSIKRFYQVSNHRQNYIRAWHGHKLEEKYVYVSSGAALIGAVPLNSMNVESCKKFVLSSTKPSILKIPAGYANGFKNLTENTIIQFFSTTTLEEAKGDDYRFPFDLVDIWGEDFR